MARTDLRPENWSSYHESPTGPDWQKEDSVRASFAPELADDPLRGRSLPPAARFPQSRGSESGEAPDSNGQNGCALWSVNIIYIRSSVSMHGRR